MKELELEAMDPLRLRLFNVLSLRAATLQTTLGGEPLCVRLLARPSGFACRVELFVRLGADLWRLRLSDDGWLSAHPFMQAPETRGLDPASLPAALRRAIARKLADPLLAQLGDRLGAPAVVEAVEFEPSVASAPAASIDLAFSLRGRTVYANAAPASDAQASGAVDRLIRAATLLPRASRGFLAQAVERVPLELAVAAGFLELERAEAATLRPGDVLLPQWLPLGGAVRFCVRSGGRTLYEADGRHADASAVLASPWRPVQENPSMLSTDDIPLTLTFELDSRTISVGELKSLEPGYVFQLAADAEAPVTVRANGRALARGRLVDVNGVLGVELVETAEPVPEPAQS